MVNVSRWAVAELMPVLLRTCLVLAACAGAEKVQAAQVLMPISPRSAKSDAAFGDGHDLNVEIRRQDSTSRGSFRNRAVAEDAGDLRTPMDFLPNGQTATQLLAGTIDMRAPTLAAIAAAGVVYLPCGTYTLASPMSISGDLIGAGRGCVTITTSFPSRDAVTMTGAHTRISGVSFTSSVTRTGGAFITLTGEFESLQDFALSKGAIGVHISKATLSTIRDGEILDTVATSTYAKSTGVLVDGAPEGVLIDNILVNQQVTTNKPRSCVELQSSDALILRPNNFINCGSAVLIDPGAGQFVLSTQIENGYLDTAVSYGLEINPTGNGNVTRLISTGTWFGDSKDGIFINNSGTGQVSGLSFVNAHGTNNTSWFAAIASPKVREVSFLGGCTAGNGSGNFMGAVPVKGIHIIGVSQSSCGTTPSPVGVAIADGSLDWIIDDNDFLGVANPITGSRGLAGASFITNNLGYNPVGTHPIRVGESPFAYRAGPSPETVYVSGGKVLQITTGQVEAHTGLTAGAFTLGPHESLGVTYLAAPTVMTSVH